MHVNLGNESVRLRKCNLPLVSCDCRLIVYVDAPAGALCTILSKLRTNPRVYIGCMKSGPVLAQK